MPEAWFQRTSEAIESAAGGPWAVYALVALATAAGLVMWLVGRRMLKPMVVALAALVGASCGLFLVSATAWGSSLSVWHGLGVGAAAGALVGLLLYRSAMAVGFGLVMAALAPMAAAAMLERWPLGEVEAGSDERIAVVREVDERRDDRPRVRVEPARAARGSGGMDGSGVGASGEREGGERERGSQSTATAQAGGRVGGRGPAFEGFATVMPGGTDVDWERVGAVASGVRERLEGASVPEELRPALDASRAAFEGAAGRAREAWSGVPARHQAVVATAAALGLAGGIVIGLAAPAWTASAVTAMLGAGLWLGGLAWLSGAMGAPWRGAFEGREPAWWLAVWGVAAALGLAVQWSGVLRRRPVAATARPA